VNDLIVGMGGWQDHAVLDAASLRRLSEEDAPLSTALGVLGMPGLTAYVGLLDMGEPKPGETVLVSAAAGTVGSVVGQIAKLRACRVVGIAGSAEKCDYLRSLGFDSCVDYKRAPNLKDALAAACPSGVDVYFDNVGGPTFAAAASLLNCHARIVLCGMMAQLNASAIENIQDLRPLFVKRAQLRPILVSDHMSRHAEYARQAQIWIRDGQLRYREHFVDGLENAVTAFTQALTGDAIGKHILRISDGIQPIPQFRAVLSHRN
jgi:hypothetical protein